MKQIIFLASGGGGNMKFFHQAILNGIISDVRLSVIADRECGSIEYATRHGIDNHIVSYSRAAPGELVALLEDMKSDVIVTNWHKIIDESTVRQYSGRLVNLHYSLLPAFAGLIGVEPIKLAYEQGCKFIGPTCHLVNEGVDTGKILAQAIFTTERPIDEAISLMLRKGCLVLLSGIQNVLHENLVTGVGLSNESYSPKLTFDEGIFDEKFWEKVALA